MMTPEQKKSAALRFIVFLGLVSLCADMTYEGARSITGPLLGSLGATAAQVGLISGLGEFCGFALRLFSGSLADRTRAYWTITILGYGVNMIAVPLLTFAGNWQTAALLIIAERAGKSLRAPARDVLLSEAAQTVGQGWAFGLHAAFDQTGAVIGPLFVAWAIARTHSYGPAFRYLAIPAGAAILMLLVARSVAPPRDEDVLDKLPDQPLPPVFWLYVAAAAMLAIGYCDFPLIAYHFQKTGLTSAATIPLIYAGAMVMNGATAPLFGILYDHIGLTSLTAGILISMCALPLAFFGNLPWAIVGVCCWGAGMGAMDATLRAGISQVVSMNKRGRAFGVFNAVYGLAWLIGSTAMGLLYEPSLVALVGLGIVAQLASAGMFFGLRKRIK